MCSLLLVLSIAGAAPFAETVTLRPVVIVARKPPPKKPAWRCGAWRPLATAIAQTVRVCD